MTFQVVLSTDGKASFAVFIYLDPSSLMLDYSRGPVVGFNAGDRTKLSNIPVESLGLVNLLRIDGISIQCTIKIL